MTTDELSTLIKGGESSTVQFKEHLPHIDSLAHEIIALLTSKKRTLI